jgi:cyclic dehypoxanthinyl futalosine synthase
LKSANFVQHLFRIGMKEIEELIDKAVGGGFLSHEEGIILYDNAPDALLFHSAHQLRKKIHPEKKVGWIIDRNINITNICFSFCKFCNFCRKSSDEDAYITTIDEYRLKINELFSLGGKQLLLQGGMHPKLGLDFYTDLFLKLKQEFPDIRLHALGPPEIVHLARLEKSDFSEVLIALRQAGMDSLPGAGAEILVQGIRDKISSSKCSAEDWLEVMRVAHTLNFPTSATMMYGHVENMSDRIEHLIRIREVQAQKPEGHYGFLSFIPWPFMDKGTVLRDKDGIRASADNRSYLRLIAISRLMLPNIDHIQASWLTVGKETGQLCLHSGADDFGSIMIEENVVSAAGAETKMNAIGIQKAIREAGFEPYQRNQLFDKINYRENPPF